MTIERLAQFLALAAVGVGAAMFTVGALAVPPREALLMAIGAALVLIAVTELS